MLRYLGTREIGAAGLIVARRNGNARGTAIGKLKRLMAVLAANLEQDRTLVSLIFRKGVTAPDLLAGDAGGFSLQPVASLLIRQAQYNGEVNPRPRPRCARSRARCAVPCSSSCAGARAHGPIRSAERLTGIVDLLLLGIGAME